MGLTKQQRIEYLIYRAACRWCGIAPSLKDFIAGRFPDSVRDRMELEQNELEQERREAITATA